MKISITTTTKVSDTEEVQNAMVALGTDIAAASAEERPIDPLLLATALVSQVKEIVALKDVSGGCSGWILKGWPCTVEQAKMLGKYFKSDAVSKCSYRHIDFY